MKEERVKWYGWIPTNRGKINFNFIEFPENLKSNNVTKDYHGNKIIYKGINVSYLSDSHTLRKYFFLQNECSVSANIEFEYRSNQILGSIEIIYKDFCSLRSKFVCELNGVVEFENIFYDIDSIQNEVQEIKSLLYVLVKTIIHGDAHHHQKIDVALPIIDNKFNPSEVSSSLLDYIKLAERNVKKTNDCSSLIRNENLVYEINGYMSYFKSFVLLFEDDVVKKDFEFAQNVVESLKSTVAKRKNKADYEGNIKTAIITFFGLFISINILLNGFWKADNNSIISAFSSWDRITFLFGSFFLILYLFYQYISCKIHSYLYYYQYNFYEFSNLIRNAKFFDLNWKGKLYKIFPILLIVISILIFIISSMQDISHT